MKNKTFGRKLFVLGGIVLVIASVFYFSSHLNKSYIDMLVALKGKENISWGDFERFSHEDIGSGYYVYKYDMVGGSYLYLIGGDLSTSPSAMHIINDEGEKIEIK